MELHGDGFLTRPLGEEMITPLLDLYRQCADFLALGPDPVPSIAMIRRDLDTTRAQGGVFSGIFLPDGCLAGVLDVIPMDYKGDAGTAYLELLMLGKPYRGRGLGERVYLALEDDLVARGVRRLQAGVQVNNPSARRFWQRMGFRVTSAPIKLEDGTVCEDLEKELPHA